MGGGSFSSNSFASYSRSVGKSYNSSTGRVSGQTFKASQLKEVLNPKNVIRECANSDEHPNTIPVILALDVTGSMGDAYLVLYSRVLRELYVPSTKNILPNEK